ncbi:MAG: type II toxin-antitoxin system ChpB family toxin [Gammaproteobacteria bacterium]|nr:type II toxin-antitoxin system ChpB family toxin [Gammaproteobacteria bacterium]
MNKFFDRGDIVLSSLDPVVGNELQGNFRPLLVISPKLFNSKGLTYVAPITQGGNKARSVGFSVALSGSGTETQGVILVNSIRSLDLISRKAKKIEEVPDFIIEEVLSRLATIIL